MVSCGTLLLTALAQPFMKNHSFLISGYLAKELLRRHDDHYRADDHDRYLAHEDGLNGWTATTIDGSYSAQYEHSIAITKEGPVIMTLQKEEREHHLLSLKSNCVFFRNMNTFYSPCRCDVYDLSLVVAPLFVGKSSNYFLTG